MLRLLLESADPTEKDNEDEWRQLYFSELNDHLRALFDLLQKTAAGTFVINPALGAAFAYSQSKGALLFWFSFFICAIGICFNLGALAYFINCRLAVRRLFESIDKVGRSEILGFEASKHFKQTVTSWLTIFYFCLLATAFACGGAVTFWRLRSCFAHWSEACLSTTAFP